VRPPTVIDPGRLVAGRHPSAWGADAAPGEVQSLLDHGVTLFVDLTQAGELEPYEHLVPAGIRYVRRPVLDFSVPAEAELVTTLDILDAEIDAGGLVYVHCWAGCGRTGVVVGSWLVRHGADPREALARIAETRGPGCPQTLQQQLLVLGWEAGR
jgi:protein-tyrosine phosphatase